jgi:hypothetical protein
VYATVTGGVHELVARAGGDPQWGSHAYQAMVTADFIDCMARAHSQSWAFGRTSAGAQLHRANAMQVRARLLSTGLVTEREFGDFLQLLDSPEFVVMSYPLIGTWGRRPGRGQLCSPARTDPADACG